MSDTVKLSLVAGSWLFHDDDANLWQLGLFAKIGRSVSRFITIVKGVLYVTKTSPCSRRLRLSKFSGAIGPPGVMRVQFRLKVKYVAGLRRSTRARRIARSSMLNVNAPSLKMLEETFSTCYFHF